MVLVWIMSARVALPLRCLPKAFRLERETVVDSTSARRGALRQNEIATSADDGTDVDQMNLTTIACVRRINADGFSIVAAARVSITAPLA